MLLKHGPLAQTFAGRSAQWLHAFACARPEDFLSQSSVWMAAYPDSLIGQPGTNVLDILGSAELHQLLADVGVNAVHTGPMKLSGSVTGMNYGPSIDGHFDRIESVVDPQYGSEDQYRKMVQVAAQHGTVIIGDLVPGHTGKGPDFRLATLGEPEHSGLYTMIEIDAQDWAFLPVVPKGRDSVNLSVTSIRELKQRGYKPIGPLDAEVFARPGIKESSWSVTDTVRGVDGKDRRWVYLHIFKAGQPSLNWSDPSFAAHRLMTADMLHSLTVLGARGLRLDATMFLGMETGPDSETGWLCGHPLSTTVTDCLGMMIRKFGGFSFQELNTDLDTLRRSLPSGSEYNYDFSTRPGYLYALVMRDGGPLRLMLRQLISQGIQPKRLVHGLQNHDELMLESTHFQINGAQKFEYEGHRESGAGLFRRMHEEVIAASTGDKAPYNESFAMSPGVCSTMSGLIAAGLGVQDLEQISAAQKKQITQLHLLAAAFNALQGGVFLISGWDLVGALPVPGHSVEELVADNDYRWINRGGYDLIGSDDSIQSSLQGLPRARSLYGGLAQQLADPDSFASRLKSMLALRTRLGIAVSELVSVPQVDHPGLVVMVNKLPEAMADARSLQLTALNFGDATVEQCIRHPGLSGDAQVLWSSLQRSVSDKIPVQGESLTLTLQAFEAQLVIAAER